MSEKNTKHLGNATHRILRQIIKKLAEVCKTNKPLGEWGAYDLMTRFRNLPLSISHFVTWNICHNYYMSQKNSRSRNICRIRLSLSKVCGDFMSWGRYTYTSTSSGLSSHIMTIWLSSFPCPARTLLQDCITHSIIIRRIRMRRPHWPKSESDNDAKHHLALPTSHEQLQNHQAAAPIVSINSALVEATPACNVPCLFGSMVVSLQWKCQAIDTDQDMHVCIACHVLGQTISRLILHAIGHLANSESWWIMPCIASLLLATQIDGNNKQQCDALI